MKLHRRKFLFGAAAAVVAGGAFWLVSPHAFIVAAIRDHFRPGEVSDADIADFANDFMEFRPQWGSLKHRVFGRLGVFGLQFAPHLDGPSRMREDAISAFLLGSTAMLRQDPDEAIAYLAFPDPYQSGCLPAFY